MTSFKTAFLSAYEEAAGTPFRWTYVFNRAGVLFFKGLVLGAGFGLGLMMVTP